VSSIARHGIRECAEGIEIMCDACAEWWPATSEFWSRVGPQRDRRLSFARCRACHNAAQRRHFADPDARVHRRAAQAKYRAANLATVRFKERERARRLRRAA
jgi:hypothetical protein